MGHRRDTSNYATGRLRQGMTPLEMKVSNSYATGLESSHISRKFLTGMTLVEMVVAMAILLVVDRQLRAGA